MYLLILTTFNVKSGQCLWLKIASGNIQMKLAKYQNFQQTKGLPDYLREIGKAQSKTTHHDLSIANLTWAN